MLRTGASLLALILFVPSVMADRASDASGTWQADTYRPAGTYRTLRGSTPDACAATCLEDDRCRAWSLKPPTFRTGPKCELKSVEGTAVSQTASLSGVVRLEEAEAPDAPADVPKAEITPSLPEPVIAPKPTPKPEREPEPVPAPPIPAPSAPPPAAVESPAPARSPESTISEPAPAATVKPDMTAPTVTPVRAFPPESTYEVLPEPQPAPQPRPAPAHQQQPPAPATVPADPDRPWPGLRGSDDTRMPLSAQTGGKPLPGLRRSERDYSIQEFGNLPGDFEDSAGIHGRLPIGHIDEVPEDDKEESDED
ncbi:PAN/Apple domain-containing protein [Henriciella sp.]|uniref:PAN/Apple domain-containing protein n=1 Tax=Henriciella sp. TaxID=1968823 RepID=UPI00260AEE8E|nr:PAN/Apple domain-containing protein [Henriciella sp.]